MPAQTELQKENGLKSCGHCKIEKSITSFAKSAKSKDGYQCWCRACNIEWEHSPTGSTWKKKYHLREETKYQVYRNKAAERGFPFELTSEQFHMFWQKPCFYCGAEIKTIGIDRVDNDQGYFIENCVPCCRICNRMKMNMSQHQFINQCNLISKKLNNQ